MMRFIALSLLLTACGAPTEPAESAPTAGGKADFIGNEGAGSPCKVDLECKADAGLICRPYSRIVSQRCALPGRDIDFCFDDDDCASGYLCQGVNHDQPNTPTYSKGIVRAGLCAPGSAKACVLDLDCGGGLVCAPSRGDVAELENRCQPPRDAGQFCAEDDDCASGLACKGAERYFGSFEVQTAGTCG